MHTHARTHTSISQITYRNGSTSERRDSWWCSMIRYMHRYTWSCLHACEYEAFCSISSLCAHDTIDPTDSIVFAITLTATFLGQSHVNISGKRLAMFACIVSFINMLLFVSECLAHVLLFVEWAHDVLCYARQRLLWKTTGKDRRCAVLHVAAMCSFNVLSMNVCVCGCLWLFYVFKELVQEGLTDDLKAMLSPLSPKERDKVQCDLDRLLLML